MNDSKKTNRKEQTSMTIEELQRKLESITGNSSIANARRLAIIDIICKMMEAQEQGE